MPRIELRDPTGMSYGIDTRNTETLHAWFQEILPHTFVQGRTGIDDFDILWPSVVVWPMLAWGVTRPGQEDPDWVTDNRVLGRPVPFPASCGDDGITMLADIRRELEQELVQIKEKMGR